MNKLKSLILIFFSVLGAPHLMAAETYNYGSFVSSLIGKDDACTAAAKPCDKMNESPVEFMNRLAHASQIEGMVKEHTVGMCARGVSYAITNICQGLPLGICGNATGMGKCLDRMHFQHCRFDQRNRRQMLAKPIKGAIYLYTGGPAGDGHVEVYTGETGEGMSSRNRQTWCSDHCSSRPMLAPTRVPFGIYLPEDFPVPKGQGFECVKVRLDEVGRHR